MKNLKVFKLSRVVILKKKLFFFIKMTFVFLIQCMFLATLIERDILRTPILLGRRKETEG